MVDIESDLSEDEEEILVYVEFEGFVDGKTFSNEKLQLDMIGLDTDFPIMQVNGKFYEGTYEDAVGTYMFFENDDNPTVDDSMFDVTPSIRYFAKTRKLLKMQRIFTMPRTEVLGDSNQSNCIPNVETIKQAGIPPKYQEKALQFWGDMRDVRMKALDLYLKKQKIREEKKLQGIKPDSESDEDNPFAMYKHKELESANTEDVFDNVSVDVDESKEVLEAYGTKGVSDSMKSGLPRKKLTVKDTEPCAVAINVDDIILSSTKSKHRASIKVVRKGKGRTKSSKKIIRKKQVLASEKQSDYDAVKDKQDCETRAEENIDVQGTETETKVADTSEVIDSRDNIESEPSVSKEFETVTSNSSSLSERLIIKQARREAKMKEISERLRKLGEESRKQNT